MSNSQKTSRSKFHVPFKSPGTAWFSQSQSSQTGTLSQQSRQDETETPFTMSQARNYIFTQAPMPEQQYNSTGTASSDKKILTSNSATDVLTSNVSAKVLQKMEVPAKRRRQCTKPTATYSPTVPSQHSVNMLHSPQPCIGSTEKNSNILVSRRPYFANADCVASNNIHEGIKSQPEVDESLHGGYEIDLTSNINNNEEAVITINSQAETQPEISQVLSVAQMQCLSKSQQSEVQEQHNDVYEFKLSPGDNMRTHENKRVTKPLKSDSNTQKLVNLIRHIQEEIRVIRERRDKLQKKIKAKQTQNLHQKYMQLSVEI